MVRLLVGAMGRVALEDRQLGLDAAPLGHQAAGQQHEDARVGHDESRLPPLPGKADQHGAEHVDGQQHVDGGEPAAVVDAEMGRRRCRSAFDQRRPGQHAGVDRDQHHGQLQRSHGGKQRRRPSQRQGESGRSQAGKLHVGRALQYRITAATEDRPDDTAIVATAGRDLSPCYGGTVHAAFSTA